jgi:hypothetical protein
MPDLETPFRIEPTRLEAPSEAMADLIAEIATASTAGGATLDEIRALARHRTRQAGEHYVVPDSRFVDAAQEKRRALRKAKANAAK